MIPRFIVPKIQRELELKSQILFSPEPQFPLVLKDEQFEMGEVVVGIGYGKLIIEDIVLNKSRIEIGMYLAKDTVAPIFYKRFIEQYLPNLRLGRHEKHYPNTWAIEQYQFSKRLKKELLSYRQKNPNKHIEMTVYPTKKSRSEFTLPLPNWLYSWKPRIELILR